MSGFCMGSNPCAGDLVFDGFKLAMKVWSVVDVSRSL